MYYIYYQSSMDSDMTWSKTDGSSTIYYPHQNPFTIYFDNETKGEEKYFIVGCIKGRDFSSFKRVGNVTCCKPASTDVCDNQVTCPNDCVPSKTNYGEGSGDN